MGIGTIHLLAVQLLEQLGYVEKVAGKGRVVSKNGMQKLDRLATEILLQLVSETPQLKVYS